MLNNKGVYYAKLIVNDIDDLKDVLINANILKPSDLGANSNLADISKSVSTEFSGDDTKTAFLMIGCSEKIYKNFYSMGSVNLEGAELAPAYNYFKELKSVYDAKTFPRSFNYYKKYVVWALAARTALKTALKKAELNEGIPNKLYGTSYSFEATHDSVISNFSIKGEDFTKVGLRLPNVENEYVQIESNEVYREKCGSGNNPTSNVVVNIIYNDDKEKNSKIYPVISTFEGKAFKIIRMISANDLINMLTNDYKADVSTDIVDMEPLYKKLNEVWRQSLQPVYFFATGKNKVHTICKCESENAWPNSVLKATSSKDLSNITLFTKRSLEHAMARKSQKRDTKISEVA